MGPFGPWGLDSVPTRPEFRAWSSWKFISYAGAWGGKPHGDRSSVPVDSLQRAPINSTQATLIFPTVQLTLRAAARRGHVPLKWRAVPTAASQSDLKFHQEWQDSRTGHHIIAFSLVCLTVNWIISTVITWHSAGATVGTGNVFSILFLQFIEQKT